MGTAGNAIGYAVRRWCKHSGIVPDHDAALLVPAQLLAAHRARARSRHDQPGLLAARSADLPVRHRQLRDAVRRVHDRASSSAASRCCSRPRSAWRSSRAWRRTSRTTTSTSITQRLGAAALLRRHPPFARAALLGVRGSAQRRNARQAAEGAVRRRAAHLGVDQRAVHVARRHHLRDGLRVHGALADRAGVPADGAGARHHQLGAEQADQDDSESRSSRRRPRWPARRPSRCGTSSWSRASGWASRRSRG